MTPLFGFYLFASLAHRLRETLPFTSSLKGMIKDTGEESGEETHRARSGRVLSTGASVPVEWVTFPRWMCSTTLREFRKIS